MIKRVTVSLKCPICLIERIVRKDGAGLLCRQCRSKENSKLNFGKYKSMNLDRNAYGKLTIISQVYKPDEKEYFWKCRCVCGNEIITSGNRLRYGKVKSCGCIVKSQAGLSTSPAYRSWDSMIQRCYDTKVAHYQRYGAKGITVCDRWRYSFLNFLEDMGQRPEEMTLDRIDSTGNYEPKNCKWSSAKQQASNRSNNHHLEFNNKRQTITDWSEETGISVTNIIKRLSLGWSVEETLTKKVNHGKKSKK